MLYVIPYDHPPPPPPPPPHRPCPRPCLALHCRRRFPLFILKLLLVLIVILVLVVLVTLFLPTPPQLLLFFPEDTEIFLKCLNPLLYFPTYAYLFPVSLILPAGEEVAGPQLLQEAYKITIFGRICGHFNPAICWKFPR